MYSHYKDRPGLFPRSYMDRDDTCGNWHLTWRSCSARSLSVGVLARCNGNTSRLHGGLSRNLERELKCLLWPTGFARLAAAVWWRPTWTGSAARVHSPIGHGWPVNFQSSPKCVASRLLGAFLIVSRRCRAVCESNTSTTWWNLMLSTAMLRGQTGVPPAGSMCRDLRVRKDATDCLSSLVSLSATRLSSLRSSHHISAFAAAQTLLLDQSASCGPFTQVRLLFALAFALAKFELQCSRFLGHRGNHLLGADVSRSATRIWHALLPLFCLSVSAQIGCVLWTLCTSATILCRPHSWSFPSGCQNIYRVRCLGRGRLTRVAQTTELYSQSPNQTPSFLASWLAMFLGHHRSPSLHLSDPNLFYFIYSYLIFAVFLYGKGVNKNKRNYSTFYYLY